VQGLFDDEKNDDAVADSAAGSGTPKEPYILSDYTPPTTAESARRVGLAWSAGVVFGGTIIFMLVLGWLFDLMVGSSPWGIVGGIILGSIIGFMQFFRISRQIFGSNTSMPAEKPLLSGTEETSERHDRFDRS
jgi:F0F1-type ATP synthase assembly protein I